MSKEQKQAAASAHCLPVFNHSAAAELPQQGCAEALVEGQNARSGRLHAQYRHHCLAVSTASRWPSSGSSRPVR